MTIEKTNVYSEAWKTIRDFLKANLTDPINNTTNSSRKWVYNREPKPGANFYGLPFIQVSDLTIPEEGKTFGTGIYLHKLRAVITIKCEERRNVNEGQTHQLDSLSNELNLAVKTQSSMTSAGIKNIKITDVGTEDSEFRENPVRVRTFTMEADLPVAYA